MEYREARILILSFLSMILTGAVLLMLPFSTKPGSISIVDALFTATSAVCVTGLIVVDTGSYFTAFGQGVIVAMIQLGGLGIMTFSTFFVITLGKKLSFTEKKLIKGTMGEHKMTDIFKILKHILVLTVIIEAIGAAAFFLDFSKTQPTLRAVWSSVFHSISAFCNAGFSLFSTSFENYTGNVYINTLLMVLIVLGGLGFIVFEDVYQYIKSKIGKKSTGRISLHSKLVIFTSLLLIILGAVLFFIFEGGNALEGKTLSETVCGSLFQSITPRTAGFNTISIYSLSNATLMMLTFLMFIGGSPGSTAGGIKTVTFAVLFFLVLARLRGKENVSIYRRKVPFSIIAKCIAIFFASLILIFLMTMLLQITEYSGVSHFDARGKFLELFFETVSAFGTVGLSTGLTANLSVVGKILITITMFVGRLGPLTMALLVGGTKEERPTFEFAEENVMIG